MDFFFKLFDLFLNTSRQLAGYLPQSGSDLIQLFQKLLPIAANLNSWITNNIGVNLQAILASLGRLIFLSFNFLAELLKQIVNSL